jgi:sialic acid synthase SpsE
MILSTGASTLEEVHRAHSWLQGTPIGFLQCLSAYPAAEAEASLAGIEVLTRETGCPCGYSDHTVEETTGGLAVAAGATILEKHFTYSRDARGPDHAASLEPESLARYIEFAHRAHRAVGPRGEKEPQMSELNVSAVARQSLRAARPLAAGKVLQADDFLIKRPADGLEPWKIDFVVGRTLERSVEYEEAITSEDLA